MENKTEEQSQSPFQLEVAKILTDNINDSAWATHLIRVLITSTFSESPGYDSSYIKLNVRHVKRQDKTLLTIEPNNLYTLIIISGIEKVMPNPEYIAMKGKWRSARYLYTFDIDQNGHREVTIVDMMPGGYPPEVDQFNGRADRSNLTENLTNFNTDTE